MSAERLRTRFLYKTLDAVLTARLRPRRRRREYLECLAGLRASRYERVAALVGLLDRLVPGAGRRAGELLFHPRDLPLATGRVELLGYGSGSTVFLLETPRGRLVLKAYRRTIGERRDVLLRLAGAYRRKHRTVSAWYRERQDVVVPAEFLICHGPLLGRPAVACVQPYLEGRKRDLLRDLQAGELVQLAGGSPELKEEFLFFASRTLERYDSSQGCPDLLGAGNLVVLGKGESARLKLLDYGILDPETLAEAPPRVSARLGEAMAQLRSLLARVATGGGGHPPAGTCGS